MSKFLFNFKEIVALSQSCLSNFQDIIEENALSQSFYSISKKLLLCIKVVYPISRTLLRRMRSSFTSCGLKEKAASMFVERFVMSFSLSLSISLPLFFWKGLCIKACLSQSLFLSIYVSVSLPPCLCI